MRGDLKQVIVPDLILQVYQARRSGVLRLQRGEEKKNIYFMDGEIVFAHSNQKQDRLGETFLRLGKITQDEFEMASREVIDRGKRLGQALQDLGILTPVDVNSGVRYQLQQIVFSVFDWDEGTYHFLGRDRPVYEDIIVDVSTPNMVLEGIRHMRNISIPRRTYGNDERCILRLNDEVSRIPRTEFDFGEETVLACVDGKKDVKALRALSRLAELEFDRAICSLLVSGVLQKSGRSEAAGSGSDQEEVELLEGNRIRQSIRERWAVSTEQKGKPRLPGLHTHSESEMRQVILDTEAKFRNSTSEEILNVFPDSSEQEIQKAYDHLISVFHPLYYSQHRFLDLKTRLKFILDKLAEAHDHLLHRAGSMLPLEVVPLSQASEGDFPPILTAESPDSSGEAIHEVHPWTLDEKVEEQQEPILMPVVQVVEGTDPVPQKETERSEGSGPGKDLMELQKKLSTDPANAELLRSIGNCLLKSGKAVEAEKQFIRALEVEPQNVENHFALAGLYQSQGLKLKAFKHLNVILHLDPQNKRAREMLGVEERRKPLYEISSRKKKSD